MVILPVVQRELSCASRKWALYGTRFGAALTSLLAGSWFWLMMHDQPDRVIGPVLFGILSVIAHTQALMAGALSAADSLSREKREGTLGLLFLTDLKSYDIVLGKLAATSCGVLYSVMALVPILGLPLLMGGVTGVQFGRVVLVLLNNLFFAAAIGILSSACFRLARQAQSAAVLTVAALSIALPVFVILFWESPWGTTYPQWKMPVYHTLVMSPGYSAFAGAMVSLGPASALPDLFFPSVAAVHLMAWGALFLACWVLPRTWQDRPTVSRTAGFRAFIQRATLGNSETRRARRLQLLDPNPFVWLASRSRIQDKLPWIFIGAVGAVWFWAFLRHPTEAVDSGPLLFFALVLQVFLLLSVGLETPRQIATDRLSGALELLLATRLTVKDIIRGQHLALLRVFLGPLICVASVQVAACSVPLVREHFNREDLGIWLAFWAAAITGLLATLPALAWVGLWTAVRRRRSGSPATESILRVCVLPVLALGLIIASWAVLSMTAPSLASKLAIQSPAPLFLMWLVLVCGNSALHLIWARRQINLHFRAEAVSPLQPQGFFDPLILLLKNLRAR